MLKSDPLLFTGRFGELSSRLDTALNIYSSEPEQPYELDESQLRRVVEPVVAELEGLEGH